MNIARAATISVAACAVAIVGSVSKGLANAEAAKAVIQVPITANTPVRDLGRAPASYPVSIVVTLPYRNDRQLEELIQAQGDPQSPYYHHFLTPAEFASRYGPTASDELSVMQRLERAGFRITQRYANRTVVDATAPAAVAERYFRTQIHLVSESGAGIRYLNARPASVPPELLARTFSVTGLNNITEPHPSDELARRRADSASVGAPLENEGGMGPLAWAQGYDMPVQHGYSGSGVTVGEIESGFPTEAGSIQMYDFAYDLHAPASYKTTTVLVDGGCAAVYCVAPGTYGPMVDEDAEYLAALAPGVARYLYQMPDESTVSLEDTFNKLVSDNHVDIATTFTQISEEEPNAETLALTLDQIIRQGVALGITFVVETTTQNYGSQTASLTIPCDSPHVLSVGASDLQVNKSGDYQSEVIWPWIGYGGEFSLWFPVPSYQQGISGLQKDGRNAPDLASAMVAEISTKGAPNVNESLGGQFPFSYEGGWLSNNITSPAVFIALVADLDQIAKARGGLVNTEIYALYKKYKYGPAKAPLFRDIVNWPAGDSGPFQPGFDLYTGIGSVDGWNLVQAMKGHK
jgi:subtilase family serine protease